MIPTPYILAKMCDETASAFDEDQLEFGVEGQDYFCVINKDGQAKVQDSDESEVNDSIWFYFYVIRSYEVLLIRLLYFYLIFVQ